MKTFIMLGLCAATLVAIPACTTVEERHVSIPQTTTTTTEETTMHRPAVRATETTTVRSY